MKKLIITGDDFGVSITVNKAIETAHREGVLSATSLMVGEAASADAVTRAKSLPDLHVGLHVVLVQGTPVSDPEKIPDLVTPEGIFRNDLFFTSCRYFFIPGIRRQLETEIRAQFQAFSDSGLKLDHVNAHNHLHLHPTILGLILKVGREFKMQSMRIPYEKAHISKYDTTGQKFEKLLSTTALAPWALWMRQRLKNISISFNDNLFGIHNSGAMSEVLLLDLLNNLPTGSTEIYFHPDLPGNNLSNSDNSELQALLSPKVKDLLHNIELKPGGFSDLTQP